MEDEKLYYYTFENSSDFISALCDSGIPEDVDPDQVIEAMLQEIRLLRIQIQTMRDFFLMRDKK